MKRLLTLIIIVFAGYTANAQCPTPSFTCVPSPSGNNLLQVSFNNTTSYTPPPGFSTNFYIDYGDGSGSNYYSSSYSYATPGTYTVTMTMVVDSADSTQICSNTFSQNVTVALSPCGTTISSSYSSSTGTSVTIDFSANTPAGATGMSYAWDFGDGTTGDGASTSHTYTSSGNFVATLTATNGGCTYTNSTTEQVVLMDCDSIFADFTYTASYNTANFTNTSANPSPQIWPMTSWDYGDGTTNGNGSHTYAAAGTYSVTLTSTWEDLTMNMNLGTCTKTVTHSVTVGNPPNKIAGNISYVDTGGAAIDSNNFVLKVWLIKLDSNILSAVDSATIYNASYQFNNEPNGTYMTKAQVLTGNGAVGADGYIPTYATSSLYWSGALNVNHTGGDDENINIIMQAGIVPSGPGFVAGNVLSGANKGTDAGIPVVGMLIYLRNASTNVLTYQYTDANGNYTFSNLPTGNYSTYPEAVGYATTPYDFTISTAQPTVNNINYKEHTISMTITPVTTTGISNVTANQMKLDVYPNPTNGTVNIQWQGADAQSAHVTITNVVGQKAFETDLNMDTSAGTEKLNVSALKDGMYLMTIKAGDVNYSQKLVIQH